MRGNLRDSVGGGFIRPDRVDVAAPVDPSQPRGSRREGQQFASGLGYAEGPLWLPDGRLIVSDVTNDVVFVFDAAGHKRVFRRPSNVANGHALDGNGAVLEAEAGDNTLHPLVARIGADGSATVLADKYRGKHLNEPNDLIAKRDGTIWFTDPSFDSIRPRSASTACIDSIPRPGSSP